jgi:alpha-L-rhamnosidase
VDENTFEWDVTVPPNTTATARFPVPANAVILEGGRPLAESPGLSAAPAGATAPTCELVSGQYHFRASWATTPR